MILSAVLLVASAQPGADVPDHFRNADWHAYERCLRSEVNSASRPWPDTDRGAPTIQRFAQLMAHCGAERSRTISALRGFIQARHPDWSHEQVAEGAEFVLTGMEIQRMIDDRRPIDDGPHAGPRERF